MIFKEKILEGKYHSLIRGMHWSLSTLVNHKVSFFNEDYTLYMSYIDNNLNYINDENEVNKFIIKNATKEFPVNKFIPYKFENKTILHQRINLILKEKLEIVESKEISRSKSRKKTNINNNYRMKVFKKKNTNDQAQIIF